MMSREKIGKTIKKVLPVKLTLEELTIKCTELSEKFGRLKSALAKKDEYNKISKSIEKETENLMVVVREQQEERSVSCYWVPSHEDDTCNLIRSDTGETILSRPMTDADRQGELVV